MVEADVFADGHDEIRVVLRWRARASDGHEWRETEMAPLGNDAGTRRSRSSRSAATSTPISGWVDHWRDLACTTCARGSTRGQDVTVDLQIGAEIDRRRPRRAPSLAA